MRAAPGLRRRQGPARRHGSTRRNRTTPASSSMARRCPVPSPRRVTFRVPAATAKGTASRSCRPRASPAASAPVIASPAPRRLSSSRVGETTSSTSPPVLTTHGIGRARDDDGPGAEGAEVRDRLEDPLERALSEPAGLDEILVAHLQDVDPPGERRLERLHRHVGDDAGPVGREVSREPPVHVHGQVPESRRARQDGDAGGQARGQRRAVEPVHLVTVERGRLGLADGRGLAVAAGGDPYCAGAVAGDRDDIDPVQPHQLRQERPRPPPDGRAHPRLRPELRGHPTDPEPLAPGVQVDLVRAVLARVHRDHHPRRGLEDGDRGTRAHETIVPRARHGRAGVEASVARRSRGPRAPGCLGEGRPSMIASYESRR